MDEINHNPAQEQMSEDLYKGTEDLYKDDTIESAAAGYENFSADLSATQLLDIRSRFDEVDVDHSGRIADTELNAVLKALGDDDADDHVKFNVIVDTYSTTDQLSFNGFSHWVADQLANWLTGVVQRGEVNLSLLKRIHRLGFDMSALVTTQALNGADDTDSILAFIFFYCNPIVTRGRYEGIDNELIRNEVFAAMTFLVEEVEVDMNVAALLSPLMCACTNTFVGEDAARYLIVKGCDLNSLSHNGSAALHYSVFSGLSELTKLLILSGADTTIENQYGKTAFDYATKDGSDGGPVVFQLGGGMRTEAITGRMSIYEFLQDEWPAIKEEKKVRETQNEAELDSNQQHIMISYSWAQQPIVLRVAEFLKGAGFNIWLDVEQMGGSTLAAMAAAVEGASCVLVCLSSDYAGSDNCRLEAEYTIQQKKKIIPLMMEKGFQAQSWLGMLLGTKLYYNFATRDFDPTCVELLKAMGKMSLGEGKRIEQPAGPASPPKREVMMTCVELTEHLRKEGLSEACVNAISVEELDERALVSLWKNRRELPTLFEAYLKDLAPRKLDSLYLIDIMSRF